MLVPAIALAELFAKVLNSQLLSHNGGTKCRTYKSSCNLREMMLVPAGVLEELFV